LKSARRIIITLFCLLAAIACYVIGIPIGGVLFLVLGIIFEGVFWLRLFRRNEDTS